MTLTESTRTALERRYQKAAEEYLASLPLEHFMESTPHARQREITLESLALVKARRPDVHVYNELLVQYQLPRRKKLGQVVPDNMVVIYDGPLNAGLSYNLPLVKARPFWMLEYVSKRSKQKDYVDNMRKYERELKTPYYLLFGLDKRVLTLYRHVENRYVAVMPNAAGRLEIPELDLEMAVLDGWVRFWHKGEILRLPGEMLKGLEAAERENAELRKRLKELTGRKNGAK